jgi:hypothetical protein
MWEREEGIEGRKDMRKGKRFLPSLPLLPPPHN